MEVADILKMLCLLISYIKLFDNLFHFLKSLIEDPETASVVSGMFDQLLSCLLSGWLSSSCSSLPEKVVISPWEVIQ